MFIQNAIKKTTTSDGIVYSNMMMLTKPSIPTRSSGPETYLDTSVTDKFNKQEVFISRKDKTEHINI